MRKGGGDRVGYKGGLQGWVERGGLEGWVNRVYEGCGLIGWKRGLCGSDTLKEYVTTP